MSASGQHLLAAGRLADARLQFWAELDAAVTRHDPEALAHAALGLGGVWVHEHRSVADRARVLDAQRRALAQLDPTSSLALRLRARLAAEDAYLTDDATPVLAALDDARASGDAVAVAEALSLAHHCILGPDHGPARLALADELIAVAAATHRPRDMLHGLLWRTVDLFLAGDRHAQRCLAELQERLARDPCDCFGYVVAALDVMLAIRAGQLHDAEAKAETCFAFGQAVGDADAFGWYGAQLVVIRWYEGRGAELLPVVKDMTNSTSLAAPNEAFLAALAVLAVAAGDVDEARAALASLSVHGLASIPRSSNWLVTMLAICEAAHMLGDATVAREAYTLLEPFAALPVMGSLAVVCLGSAHRALALAAATTGALDTAIKHLEAARLADLAIHHIPAYAMDSATLADFLDDRGNAMDAERAASLRADAIAAARRSDMEARAADWEAATKPVVPGLSVTCGGDDRSCRVTVGDRTATVPQTVGMTYLVALVDRMGEPVPALDLVSGQPNANVHVPREPVIDEQAKAAYRRRIEELQDDIDEAERNGDDERAARARLELDQYIDELARVTGLAGRMRAFGDELERARVSVNKALKRALVQIEQADPDVADEVRARLVTGVRCSFLPNRPAEA